MNLVHDDLESGKTCSDGHGFFLMLFNDLDLYDVCVYVVFFVVVVVVGTTACHYWIGG